MCLYIRKRLFICLAHAKGGIRNGGVACVCAKGRVFVHICAFGVFFVRFGVFSRDDMTCRTTQIRTELWKNLQQALSCNTPLSHTPLFHCAAKESN